MEEDNMTVTSSEELWEPTGFFKRPELSPAGRGDPGWDFRHCSKLWRDKMG